MPFFGLDSIVQWPWSTSIEQYVIQGSFSGFLTSGIHYSIFHPGRKPASWTSSIWTTSLWLPHYAYMHIELHHNFVHPRD